MREGEYTFPFLVVYDIFVVTTKRRIQGGTYSMLDKNDFYYNCEKAIKKSLAISEGIQSNIMMKNRQSENL